MFRSRFNDAFPKSLTNLGPQELERDVTDSVPGERVEQFLCAVLGLLLNRKQDVKYDAIATLLLHYCYCTTLLLHTSDCYANKVIIADLDIITELWRMPYLLIRINGLELGRTRTLCRVATPSPL